jgi:hypothetical protein
LADARYRVDFVRFTPNKRHSGRGWECLKLTRLGHLVPARGLDPGSAGLSSDQSLGFRTGS